MPSPILSTPEPVALLQQVAGCLNDSSKDKILLAFLGLPPNPNDKAGKHWTQNARTAKEWRTLACYTAKASKARVINSMALLHFHISYGDNRRHDVDNTLASMKHVIDGIVDSGLLEDDSMDYVIPIITADRQKPRGFTISIYSLD